MENLLPSIYDIEFWKNITMFSIGVSAILAMIIFKIISDVKSKIEVVLKQIETLSKKLWFDEETNTITSRRSKLYKVRDEEQSDDE